MSLPKIKEILDSNFSNEELEIEISKVKRQIFELRLKKATSPHKSIKPHFFKHARHKLAQLMMIKNPKFKSNQK